MQRIFPDNYWEERRGVRSKAPRPARVALGRPAASLRTSPPCQFLGNTSRFGSRLTADSAQSNSGAQYDRKLL